MMIGAGVVFAEPSVDQGVVGKLIVNPQEKELSGLQVRLELERNRLERGSFFGYWFQLGCNHLRE
jgi:hypothetical protein